MCCRQYWCCLRQKPNNVFFFSSSAVIAVATDKVSSFSSSLHVAKHQFYLCSPYQIARLFNKFVKKIGFNVEKLSISAI